MRADHFEHSRVTLPVRPRGHSPSRLLSFGLRERIGDSGAQGLHVDGAVLRKAIDEGGDQRAKPGNLDLERADVGDRRRRLDQAVLAAGGAARRP